MDRPDLPNNFVLVDAQFSAVESEVYPFNPSVIKAIRALKPEFVPLVVRRLWRSTTHTEKLTEHHCLAFSVRDPHKHHQQRMVLWPTSPASLNYGYQGTALNLEDILMSGEDKPNGLPGEFHGITWGTYREMADRFKAREEESEKDSVVADQFVESQTTAMQRAEAQFNDAINYKFEHEVRHDRLFGHDPENPSMSQE